MTEETKNLRAMLGKGAIVDVGGKSGNYNKRAIPFSLDNEVHVAGLQAICEQFADPWNTGRAYARGDLATDISEFFMAIQRGAIVVSVAETAEPTPKKTKKKSK